MYDHLRPAPADLQVFDTTLRDDSQQEGLNLSVADKLAITGLLDELGVGFIEGGWPGANPGDTAYFAAMAEGGVWSVMMPVTGPAAIAVRPTVVFAPLSLPPGRQPMDAVVALAASDPTAEVIDIDPLVALRTSRTDDVTEVLKDRASAVVVEMVAERSVETRVATAGPTNRALARRVRYVLGDAEDDDNWVDVLFSVTHLD